MTTPSQSPDHGWLATRTLETQVGNFEFKGGYPTTETAQRLADALFYSRAVEAYLSQMHVVSWFHVWKGVAEAGGGAPNQMVIWETLMDAATLLLTGNTETVYGLISLDLKRDGPVVLEMPPKLLGGITDMWQNENAGIGPMGADKGEGGKFLLLPPGYTGSVPDGYITVQCTNYRMSLGVRGFQVEGKTDHAVGLMKTTKIYPLANAANPPATTFVNGSGKEIDTVFPDTYQFFEDLAKMVDSEPIEALKPHERALLAAIGIAKGLPFTPDTGRKQLLADAVGLGSALARANSFASTDPARIVYPDRKWEWAFIGGSATWDSQGYVNTDRRAAFAYIAIGMSPAMVNKVVGQGSQYLWTPRDASGAYLDGGKSYQLHLPPNIPAKNFWSVVVYDAVSRSMLRNREKFPAISQYTGPEINKDGSVDIYFGPNPPPGKETNWIKTVNGTGWFPLLRFYGPLEPFFDRTWKPNDIETVK